MPVLMASVSTLRAEDNVGADAVCAAGTGLGTEVAAASDTAAAADGVDVGFKLLGFEDARCCSSAKLIW
jgi:hypothetical protein